MSANIYIIEDEEPIITLIKYNLEKEGYKVSYSDNGNDGIKEIKKKLPDLILLDWMLPDFSGVEICKNLKKDIKFKDLPIIMLTAKGEEEDKVKGLNSGADDYITKPFSFPELLARIKALLRRSKPSVISDTVLFDDLKIDRMTRRVYRKDTEVHLDLKNMSY